LGHPYSRLFEREMSMTTDDHVKPDSGYHFSGYATAVVVGYLRDRHGDGTVA
jgi:hypothetical protein